VEEVDLCGVAGEDAERSSTGQRGRAGGSDFFAVCAGSSTFRMISLLVLLICFAFLLSAMIPIKRLTTLSFERTSTVKMTCALSLGRRIGLSGAQKNVSRYSVATVSWDLMTFTHYLDIYLAFQYKFVIGELSGYRFLRDGI